MHMYLYEKNRNAYTSYSSFVDPDAGQISEYLYFYYYRRIINKISTPLQSITRSIFE